MFKTVIKINNIKKTIFKKTAIATNNAILEAIKELSAEEKGELSIKITKQADLKF